MKSVNVSELEGAALDWAAAMATKQINIKTSARLCIDGGLSKFNVLCNEWNWTPSTDWSQGGPLIERYKAEFRVRGDSYECRIEMWDDEEIGYDEIKMIGPDHLIAAMRAIVSAEIGETVDVPKELMK